MVKSIKDLQIENYQYNLPDSRIAKYPLERREISKLLVYRKGEISEDRFYNIGNLLTDFNTLIFNNTRVIHARLQFSKSTGARIEIFCLEPIRPASYALSLSATGETEWRCLVGNLKKWKEGNLKMMIEVSNTKLLIVAEKTDVEDNSVLIRFKWEDKSITFGEILEAAGHIPVPPYLNRSDEPVDKIRYQTVYSALKGSVAAPTAGLHFTPEIIEELIKAGLKTSDITLHVGAGTFRPVKSDTIGGHRMHSEHFIVARETVESLYDNKIVAVGTTTVRTIESIYWLGVQMLTSKPPEPDNLVIRQWDSYVPGETISIKESLDAIINYMEINRLSDLAATTGIIIVPGYDFRFVKGLITNYHMPGSTLLLLVAALIGDRWKDVYQYALDNDFRFLSYGDSSLLIP